VDGFDVSIIITMSINLVEGEEEDLRLSTG
jgi:hypothetical protein